MKRRLSMTNRIQGGMAMGLVLFLLCGSLPALAAPNAGAGRDSGGSNRNWTLPKESPRPLASDANLAGSKTVLKEKERPLEVIKRLQSEADDQATTIATLKKKVNLSYQAFKDMLPQVKKQVSRLTGDELVALRGAIDRMTEQRTTVDALRDANVPLLQALKDARAERDVEKTRAALEAIKKNQDSMTAALTQSLNEFERIKKLLPTKK